MIKIVTLFLTAVMYSGMTLACSKPEAPVLPDVSTAVTAQMVKEKNQVKVYMVDAKAYLECVKSTADHNSMIDEMQQLADAFNAMVRAYKDRMANA